MDAKSCPTLKNPDVRQNGAIFLTVASGKHPRAAAAKRSIPQLTITAPVAFIREWLTIFDAVKETFREIFTEV